jgi:methyltransferase (TIGR00027 family)
MPPLFYRAQDHRTGRLLRAYNILMRRGQRSRTAEFVAYNRALGNLAPSVPGFSDPMAVEFLPERWQKKVDHARVLLDTGTRKSPYPFWHRSMGIFNQFRTVMLDRAIAAGPAPEQLVILGAGLDSRAWRMDALKSTIVFEVDHPASQAWKREHASRLWSRGLAPKAREIRYIPMDFERDRLAPRLESADFDRLHSTFWLWEGVTMYLRPASVDASLGAFAELSAAGSRIALTYLRKRNGHVPRALMLALFGEPLRSAFSPNEMAELARSHSWRAESDTTVDDWLRETPELKLKRRQVGLQWLESIWMGEIAR